MNRRDRWRSFLRLVDRSFTGWFERLPPWGQMILLPPAALFAMVEWAGYFPRATAAAALILVAVYVPLLWSGDIIFSWGGTCSYLGEWCIKLVAMLYGPLLGMWLIWPHLRGITGKRSPERPGSSFLLWDREMDG